MEKHTHARSCDLDGSFLYEYTRTDILLSIRIYLFFSFSLSSDVFPRLFPFYLFFGFCFIFLSGKESCAGISMQRHRKERKKKLTRVELVGAALVKLLVAFGRHADYVPFNAWVIVLQVDANLDQIVR